MMPSLDATVFGSWVLIFLASGVLAILFSLAWVLVGLVTHGELLPNVRVWMIGLTVFTGFLAVSAVVRARIREETEAC